MSLYTRLRNTFHRPRLDRDLNRELAFHIAERADQLREQGVSDPEAQARRQFGNLTLQTERTRDVDLSPSLEAFLRNLRIGLRSLRRAPLLSAAVIVTLALGIGANSAVFSAIDAILLRPLPFPESDQLMRLSHRSPQTPATQVAPVRVEDWNRLNTTFQAITGYYTDDASESSGELPEKLKRGFVAPRFLDVWGIAPALGRDFSPEEEHLGGPAAVLISDAYWRRHFSADPAAIGQHLRLGSASPTVIGILPPSFAPGELDVDIWSLVPTDAPLARLRTATWYNVIGRLKPATTIEQARADLASVQAHLGEQFPDTDAKLIVDIQPLKEETVGGIRRSLWIVFGSVSLLLLIACANIAALLLSRAIQRQQEIAIRFSLGASRLSIAMQMLTETGILALCGSTLGLLLAAAAPAAFRALAGNLPRMQEVHLDWRIAAYSFACAVAVTLLAGIIPALRSARQSKPDSGHRIFGRHRLQWLLVGVQVALAVILLAGAGLLLRSFQALGRVFPGFESAHVLTFHVSGSYAETANYPGLVQRIERSLDFLRTVPAIEASATALTLPGVPAPPMGGLKFADGAVDPSVKLQADNRFVSPGYFAVMQIPLLAGVPCPAHMQLNTTPGRSPFDTADVLVNRSFANAYLHGTAGLGRHIQGLAGFPPGIIRGIVGDARERGLHREPGPTVYWCFGAAEPSPYFLVRTAGDPSAMIQTIRKKLHEIEPQRSVFDLVPLPQQIDQGFSQNRLRTTLLAAFALTAVLLACIGLYSTLSYLVTVRQKEVGLRLALGAEAAQIVRHFLRQGITVTCAACAAGLVLALAFTRLLAGMLYGVSPTDPFTLSAVILTVLLVGTIASLAPALRASRVDPMQVLRND